MAEAGLEPALLARLTDLVTHPAARGLIDDAAVLDWPLGLQLVATHDMLAEGVHVTDRCPPADIGWKLVAVNLSDLAAMGARPVVVLMGAGIGSGRDVAWASALVAGVGQALDRFGGALLGGDTIRTGAASVLSLTALGSVPAGTALGRAGARPGDDLWVSGFVGDAGLGLQVALGRLPADPALLRRYRRPTPRLALGLELRGLASAAIDVSDGLLIDAGRLAAASGLEARIDSEAVPVSPAARATGTDVSALMAMGDDYELLFTAPPGRRAEVAAAAARARTPVRRIGDMQPGTGIRLDGQAVEPEGWQHL